MNITKSNVKDRENKRKEENIFIYGVRNCTIHVSIYRLTRCNNKVMNIIQSMLNQLLSPPYLPNQLGHP